MALTWTNLCGVTSVPTDLITKCALLFPILPRPLSLPVYIMGSLRNIRRCKLRLLRPFTAHKQIMSCPKLLCKSKSWEHYLNCRNYWRPPSGFKYKALWTRQLSRVQGGTFLYCIFDRGGGKFYRLFTFSGMGGTKDWTQSLFTDTPPALFVYSFWNKNLSCQTAQGRLELWYSCRSPPES